MPNYGIDLNIGRPVKENFIEYIEVQNFTGVITSIENISNTLDETNKELKQIRLGTGLIIGENLSEEAE